MSAPEPTPVDDRLPATPDVPTTLAARRGLRNALRRAARLVAHCARRSPLDADAVHQLRVALRRADAALITFRPLLPHRKRRRLRKRLKRLRRRAGLLRDVDVLLERLAALTGPRTANLAAACRRLKQHRRVLADDLRSAARREVEQRFKRRAKRIVTRTRWRATGNEPPLADAARMSLRPVANRLRAAGARDLTQLRRLHRFRAAVKRLRYALELVEPGLDTEACARVRDRLSDLQSRLGQVCDHAAAVRLLSAESAALSDEEPVAALDAMIRREQELLAERQAAFVTAWQDWGQVELQEALEACLN